MSALVGTVGTVGVVRGEMAMVYFVMNGLTFHIKIGFTAKDDVMERVKTLQTGNSGILHLLAIRPGEESVEKSLHKQFAAYRVQKGTENEWFHPGPELIRYIIGCEAFKMAKEATGKAVIGLATATFPEAEEEKKRREELEQQRVIAERPLRAQRVLENLRSCDYVVEIDTSDGMEPKLRFPNGYPKSGVEDIKEYRSELIDILLEEFL